MFANSTVSELNIKFSNTIQEVSSSAFQNCSKLEHIQLPESITSIGKYAFNYASIKNLKIPKSVVSIDNQAFSGFRYPDTLIWDEDS